MSQINPVIVSKNAFVIQHNHHQVLADVNFIAMPGEFIYLTGTTGSGKSSFLKTLYGDLNLVDGSIHVLGQQLNGLASKSIPFLRRKIGMVFQDFKLLDSMTAYDNLDFVLKATDWTKAEDRKKRIRAVLEEVSLEYKADQFPHELSGGEQQRLAIARAILNDPKVILADEPTGNLDPKLADEIIGLLHYLTEKGTCVIMATHDYRLVNKFPGTIYRLADGLLEKRNFIS